MAIKNASDLLVYKKSPTGVKQVTKISCLITSPFDVYGNGELNVTNITDNSGVNVLNQTLTINSNTGASIQGEIFGMLYASPYDYAITAGNDGTYTSLTLTNYLVGNCETLDIVSGLNAGGGVLKEGAIIIEVLTTGETAGDYEPIGHSTSASISFSKDLRDVTTKDSNGYQENVSGLSSFELSTDALQDVNTDLEFKDFFDDIKNANEVSVRFAERGSGTKWEGSGFITSVSLDAGVEENTTYSVSITGTAAVTKGTY
tara:strand:- start:274 stop:1050 length:777 start_codon:yes stop_codon:yes gene_type:complete